MKLFKPILLLLLVIAPLGVTAKGTIGSKKSDTPTEKVSQKATSNVSKRATSKKSEVSRKATTKASKKQLQKETDQENRQRLYDYYFYEVVNQAQLGNYAEAFDLLTYCDKLGIEAAPVKFELAQYYILLNDKPRAEKLLKQAVELDSANYWYWNLLAAYYGGNRQFDQAIEIYEDMSRQFPRRTDILENLVDLYEDSGQLNKAISTLDRIDLIEGGETQQTQIQRFQAYMMKNDIDSAYLTIQSNPKWIIQILYDNIKTFNELEQVRKLCILALDDTPEELDYYYYIAIMEYQVGQEKQCLSWLKRGVNKITDRTVPADATKLLSLMGDIQYRMGMMDDCLETYQKAIAIDPDDVGALNNYAYFQALDGKNLKKALEYSARTIELEPTNATYLDTYAWILFVLKRYDEARYYIDLALQYGGDESADVLEHCGDIYYFCGEKEKSLEFWNRAYAAGSESKILEQKIIQKDYIKEIPENP